MRRKLFITLSLLIAFSLVTFTVFYLKKDSKSAEVSTDIITDFDELMGNESIKTDEKGLLNPYTGMVLDENESMHDAFLAIIENSRDARPQSGLSLADFVYEVMTEGGITRFLALFNSNYSEKIGPIRSARYYFLDLAKEFDLPFAHCGGSHDALDILSRDNTLKSINEMSYGNYFSRDNSRKAPHNLYTSTENIENFLSENAFAENNIRTLIFDDNFWTNEDLENCQNINLNLSNYYSTSYTYSENGYIKSMDGEETIDAVTNEPLVFNNIIIQFTNIKQREKEDYMDIELLGTGDAIIISNGKYTKGTWSKTDNNSQTIIKDSNNKIIPLSIGKTIWHIVDTTNEILIY